MGTIQEDPSFSLSWLKGKSLESAKAKKDVEKLVKILEKQIDEKILKDKPNFLKKIGRNRKNN